MYSLVQAIFRCQISLGTIVELKFSWWVLSDSAITKLGYYMVWLHSGTPRPSWKMVWKILFAFHFHILPKQRHICAWIFPCHPVALKKCLVAAQLMTNWTCLETFFVNYHTIGSRNCNKKSPYIPVSNLKTWRLNKVPWFLHKSSQNCTGRFDSCLFCVNRGWQLAEISRWL